MSHNVKAIYQRYLGWFDGNPAHLWEHPPVEKARRYVDLGGGADAVVANGQAAFDTGDYRWAAEVLSHVVFAQPDHESARGLLADTLEQLGYGSENGTWRNFYLSGAYELRNGQFGSPTVTASPDMVAQLSPDMLFDALAIQVNGPAAWDEKLSIDVVLTDTDQRYRLRLANGVLTYTAAPQSGDADLTLTKTRRGLPHSPWAHPRTSSSSRQASRSPGTPRCWTGSPPCSTPATRISPSSAPDPVDLAWQCGEPKASKPFELAYPARCREQNRP